MSKRNKFLLLAAIAIIFGGIGGGVAVAADNYKTTKRIYSTSGGDIYTDRFTDRGNVCYITYENRTYDSMPSVSCLKDEN
jgi:hypothetical protein